MIRVLVIILLLCTAAQAQRWYVVERVVDADTVVLKSIKKHVRILGINAPETSILFGRRPEPYGPEATLLLRDLLEGRKVRLGFEPKSRTDKCYDRLLYYLTTDQGVNISLRLVELGAARYEDRFYTRMAKRLQAAQDEAQAARRGMWGHNYWIEWAKTH